MKKIELESLDHDALNTEYREWCSANKINDLPFYDYLKNKWPTLLDIRHEPKMDFPDPADNGLIWAYCYFSTDEKEIFWYNLGGKFHDVLSY